MGSHTFVFAGLVIALRFKYKRRLNHQKKRRIEFVRVSVSTPGLNREGEWLCQPNIPIANSKMDALPSVIGGAGVPNDATTKDNPVPETREKCNLSSARVLKTPTSSPVYVHCSQGRRGGAEPKNFTSYRDIEEELEMRYQAFSILTWIVPLYIVLVQFWGGIALGWFISARHPSIPAENHINAWWSGIFLSASAFNNSGMSLLDANMAPFQLSYFVLLAMSALILLGNTVFPILLRIIIRCLARFIPEGDKWQGWRNGLRLLIKERSRILCPYLFTRSELFWLAGTILVFNGIDWVSLASHCEKVRMHLLLILFYHKGGFRDFYCREPDIRGVPSDSPSS